MSIKPVAWTSRDQTIARLRGQLQNCVNHLDGIKRRYPSATERLDACIESANKALYETLHESIPDTHRLVPVDALAGVLQLAGYAVQYTDHGSDLRADFGTISDALQAVPK